MDHIENITITAEEIEIFFLDDNPDFLEAMTLRMQAGGIHNKITTFTEPHKMIEALHSNTRIAIIDFYLHSDIDGIQVIRDVREKNPLCAFIMLSGQNSQQIVVDFVNIIHSGRYIEKGDIECPDKLVQYVKELIAEIQQAFIMYTNLARIKSTLTDIKNFLKSDANTITDTISGTIAV